MNDLALLVLIGLFFMPIGLFVLAMIIDSRKGRRGG